MILTTERLRLIPLQQEHLYTVLEWLKKPRVYFELMDKLPLSLSELLEWYQKREKQEDYLLETYGGKPIGLVTLGNIRPDSHNADIDRIIIGDDKYLRERYASEALKTIIRYAFRELGLKRLFTECYEDTYSFRTLAPKIGFRVDRTGPAPDSVRRKIRFSLKNERANRPWN